MAASNILDVKNDKGFSLHLQVLEPDEEGDFRCLIRIGRYDAEEQEFWLTPEEAEALQSFIDYHLNFKQ